ncbi:hypothetical protein Micbo1qcDRAFT_222303 [Microdochium bolleyi]|uniref:2EXR domain-containing protein n=1 Tax=Microdochium bolleyi TaxID=196109 RepID=A0A136J5X0_9PEZI|nr:hypothetical protein Micbo1qcDRAFT_222303 [Microdochium bolleyi]
MAAKTFHPFPRFPFEIREMIYIASIRPRVVHIMESCECPGGFQDRFEANFPCGYKVDPAIAHFSPAWKDELPLHREDQTSLASYGFSSTKTKSKPWKPTKDCPEIPLHWLMDKPVIAWELMRRSELFSNAPVPALLHTCKEARDILRAQGYELTFATRSSPPKTWFNYKIDTLYLSAIEDASPQNCSLLSGHYWEIGQFMPKDLLRIERLALSGATLVPLGCHHEVSRFCKFLQLMDVKKLHIIEWLPHNFTGEPAPEQNQFYDCGKLGCGNDSNENSSDEMSEGDDGDDGAEDGDAKELDEAVYKRESWQTTLQEVVDEMVDSWQLDLGFARATETKIATITWARTHTCLSTSSFLRALRCTLPTFSAPHPTLSTLTFFLRVPMPISRNFVC